MKLDRCGRPALTERQIEAQIVDLLKAHGWRILKTNIFAGAVIQRQGSIEPGIPDLQARRPLTWTRKEKQVVWIEVKRPGEHLNEDQKKWWLAHEDEDLRIATCPEDVYDLIGRERA